MYLKYKRIKYYVMQRQNQKIHINKSVLYSNCGLLEYNNTDAIMF